MKLTGNIRYRVQQRRFRKPVLVLQVEETGYRHEYIGGYVEGHHVTDWRDATVEDLQIKLRMSIAE